MFRVYRFIKIVMASIRSLGVLPTEQGMVCKMNQKEAIHSVLEVSHKKEHYDLRAPNYIIRSISNY